MEWLGPDDYGKCKIRCHERQYDMWAVSGFTSSEAKDPTEFIIREFQLDRKRKITGVA